MTRQMLLDKYENYKDKDNIEIILFVHMPDDSIEIIHNVNVAEKIGYISEAYDENLVHKNSDLIYITDVQFLVNGSMDFGYALNRLRAGKRLARNGWNGKGMFIYYVPSGEYFPSTKIAEKCCTNDYGKVPYLPYIAMKTVDGTVVPWLASQTDMLAYDWVELD